MELRCGYRRSWFYCWNPTRPFHRKRDRPDLQPLHRQTLRLPRALRHIQQACARAHQTAIEDITKASSNTTLKSLESALDALRITVMDGSIATDTAKQTSIGDRDAFYTNLYALQNDQNYKSLANTASLASRSSLGAAAGEHAKTDFGTLVALDYLLPFAIEGGGSALIAAHGDLYQRWQADRTARADGSTELEFSDSWLADRSKMLGWLLQNNAADGVSVSNLASRGFEQWVFEDRATDKTVSVLPNAAYAYAADKHYVTFADDHGQTLNGDRLSDRLYGGAGDDSLNGAATNDSPWRLAA